MDSIESGITILDNCRQLKKVRSGIVFIEFGTTTLVNKLHSSKQESYNAFNEFGKEIDVKDLQPKKALLPILTILLGIVTVSIAAFWKAPDAIAVTG